MSHPPTPDVIPALVAAIAPLTFRRTVAMRLDAPELGLFYDGEKELPLLLATAGQGCQWTLEGPSLIPHVFSARTYAVLRDGKAVLKMGRRWVVRYESRFWRVQARWDGHRPVAMAVEVQI